MNKTFLVMRHEFWRHITRRSFLIAVLAFPIILSVIIGGAILFFSSKAKEPVGVIDQAHILLEPAAYQAIAEDAIPFQLFADEQSAQTALDNKEIQAYLILAPDYLTTGQATLYHNGNAFDGIAGEVADYLRASLLADSDPILLARFRDNSLDVTFVPLAEDSVNRSPLAFIIPFAIGYIFVIATFSTSGFLLQAVVDEKENRTMEILITSLKPAQLMAGKIAGLISLGLVQITVWLGLAIGGLMIARANIPQFPNIVIEPTIILVAVAWFVPFYVVTAALIAAIGVSITAVSEGQQMVGIISVLSMSPMFFLGLILANPDSPLSITLSLIPFSSPLTILARTQITTVPVWQYLLSWALLVGTAVLALYLVSQLLQLGQLRYGKKLAWREIVQAIRQK
ncbi:MAG: ABC transporter permease [Anaerolineales bacterium]|nr:ABC transporter permease [Anaerolineales bacterium]